MPWRAASYTERGRWFGSPNKSFPSPFRWMNTVCAVYVLRVQEKSKGGVERSRARRGTKRRGGRAVRNPDRKRRRVVTADPEDSFLTELPATKERTMMPRGNVSSKRRERLAAFIVRLVKKVVDLDKKLRDVRPDFAAEWPALYRKARTRRLADLQRIVGQSRGGHSWVITRALSFSLIEKMGGDRRRVHMPIPNVYSLKKRVEYVPYYPKDVLEFFDELYVQP
jgi:hypothetical protein